MNIGRRTHSARYRAHLRSPEWAAIRRAALERAGYRCAFCGQTQRALRTRGRHLEVHHNSYVNLGAERPEDLTVLCAGGVGGGCHAAADRQRRAASGRRRPKRKRRRGHGELRRLKRVVFLFAGAYAVLALAPYWLPLLGGH